MCPGIEAFLLCWLFVLLENLSWKLLRVKRTNMSSALEGPEHGWDLN